MSAASSFVVTCRHALTTPYLIVLHRDSCIRRHVVIAELHRPLTALSVRITSDDVTTRRHNKTNELGKRCRHLLTTPTVRRRTHFISQQGGQPGARAPRRMRSL